MKTRLNCLLHQIWKIVPLGIIVFFFFTILKSFSVSTKNAIAFSFAMLFVFLVLFVVNQTILREKINRLSSHTSKVLLSSFFLLHIIFMVMFSLLFISEPVSDLGTIYHSALEIVQDGKVNTGIDENTSCYKFYGYSNNDYFNNCQNNIMLLVILTHLYKLMSICGITLNLTNTLLAAHLLNLFCIEIAIWLGIKILRKKYDRFTVFVYLALSFLFLPYYINAFRFYTDTIVLPFILLLLYLFPNEEKSNLSMNTSPFFLWVCLGILAFVAIQIKQSSAIVLIALFVLLLFQKRKQAIISFISFLLPVLLICIFIFQYWIHHTSWIDFSKEEFIKLPTIHWIVMGMTSSGSFNEELTSLQYQTETTIDQKQETSFAFLKTLFSHYTQNMDVFWDFEFTKAVTTWCSGTYYQNSHLSRMYQENIFQELLLSDGKYFDGFSIVLKTFSFVFIICFILQALNHLKEKNCPYTLIYSLSILGLAIFLSFWETKSRYLLSFVPLFLLASTIFLCQKKDERT